MSFDAWVVASGCRSCCSDLQLVATATRRYLVLLGVIVLDAWLLYRFFSAATADLRLASGTEHVDFGGR